MRPLASASIASLLAALLLAAPSAAIDITNGDVVVQNLGSYGFTSNNSVMSFDGGATDELYQMFGYLGNANGVVRVDFNNFNVVSAITATANIATSTVTIDANGAAVLGLTSGDVEIDYTFTLIDDMSTADEDDFAWTANVRNVSTATLDLVFYSYLDLDLAGAADFGDDIADADIYRIMVRDPDDPDSFIWRPATGPADHFEVTTYPGLRNKLDNLTAATDLADTGAMFGPADFTAAFQHDLLSLDPGDAAMIGYGVIATPEPGSGILLALGLLGLAASGRRREAPSAPPTS
jgi:uncharacterized protein (TIGR03382 family)